MGGSHAHPLVRSRAFLEAEARLDPAIEPLGPAPDGGGPLLLTGATGFIGALLLQALSRTRPMVCLVRARDGGEARTRLDAAARRWGLPAIHPGVEVLPGDLGRPGLGVDVPAWERLAHEIEGIVHYAATGAWFAPYERVADVDVGSVREVLRLATTGRPKCVHYAGSLASWASLAVPAGSRIPESTRLENPDTLLGGYCQGKWVAEALLAEAGRRGVPVAVHRLGDVKGDSRTGRGNTEDFGHRLVAACLRMGAAPDLPAYRVHYLPVDEVAATVTALVNHPEAPGHTFQLANPEVATWSELVDVARSRGWRLRSMSRDAWADLARADPACREVLPVFRQLRLEPGTPPTSFLDVGIRLYTHTHGTDNTERLLGHSGVRRGLALRDGFLDRMIASSSSSSPLSVRAPRWLIR